MASEEGLLGGDVQQQGQRVRGEPGLQDLHGEGEHKLSVCVRVCVCVFVCVSALLCGNFITVYLRAKRDTHAKQKSTS